MLHVLRRWIEANYPAELRNPPKRLHWPKVRGWYMKLSEQGWLAPAFCEAGGSNEIQRNIVAKNVLNLPG